MIAEPDCSLQWQFSCNGGHCQSRGGHITMGKRYSDIDSYEIMRLIHADNFPLEKCNIQEQENIQIFYKLQ